MVRAGPVRGFFPGAPDLAVEVLSPSERPSDTHGKVADYLAAGTRLVWVVDTERRCVTIFLDLSRPRTIAEHESLDGEDVLPGCRKPVTDFLA